MALIFSTPPRAARDLFTISSAVCALATSGSSSGKIANQRDLAFMEYPFTLLRGKSARLFILRAEANGVTFVACYFAGWAQTMSYFRSNVTNIRQVTFDLHVNQCIALLGIMAN